MKLQPTKRFVKKYRNLPQQVQKQTDQKLEFLLDNPKHPSLRVKKVKGTPGWFELSVTMNYRLVFRIVNDAYILLDIGTHSEILGR
jgi:mRNA-degrading endonuclease RelE of RelBE toxin-antitoxin system